MKIAIISDTHFGAGSWSETPDHLPQVVKKVKDADMLLLNGDTFDCSIAQYHEAFEASKGFFKAVAEQTKIKVIDINIGNHDFSLFESYGAVQGMQNDPPRPFPHVMECRVDRDDIIRLVGLPNQQESRLIKPISDLVYYKTLLHNPNYNIPWLSRLTPGIPWILSYPNVIINNTILVTHGHLFDVWGEFAYDLAKVLGLKIESLRDLCELAHPFMSASSTALTNSGKATSVFRIIQEAANNGDKETLMIYLSAFAKMIDSKTRLNKFGEWVEKVGLEYAVEWVVDTLCSKQARGDGEFPNIQNVYWYLDLMGISKDIESVVVGHSHIIVDKKIELLPFKATITNTGGWLNGEGAVCLIDTITNEVQLI